MTGGKGMDRHRIVVVDDDRRWLESIGLILGGRYDVELVADPTEAAARVRSAPCALAILDQRLSPDLTGLDLLHQLREVQPGLRAIILTGHADLDDALTSIREGAFDYLSKGRRDLTAELRIRVAKALEEPRPDEQLMELLRRGEGPELEFKSSARWDVRQNKINRDLEAVIVKTIAGFLNTDGGVLLIGVDDGANVVGLRNDYGTLRRQDRDGFEAFLTKLLLDALGKDVSPCIRVDFHRHNGEDVCRVAAKAAPHAVFVSDSEHLYIRTGNSTQLLPTRQAIEYCKARWK